MKKWEAIREFLIITFATVIVAAAVFFFLIPSHVSVGSISGLAIVLGNFIPLKISAITLVLNIFLLILGFLFIGREFGAKTVYTSLLLPVMLGVFELLFPNNQSITNDAFLTCSATSSWSASDSPCCLTEMRHPAAWISLQNF